MSPDDWDSMALSPTVSIHPAIAITFWKRAFCLTTIAIHLSGWAEEWILWSTAEFDFIQLPHAFCTGSSIMPQKINPDVLELIAGQIGARHWQPADVARFDQRIASGIQPRFAGRQTAFVRCGRYRLKSCLSLAGPLVSEAQLKRESIAVATGKRFS